MSGIHQRPPQAIIVRAYRWSWTVELVDGTTTQGHWLVLGRRRAEARARKELRRHLDKRNRKPETTTITEEDL